MRFPNRETVESIQRQYPAGCRVELVRMDDDQAPPIGTKGTVLGVDDVGSVMVSWDNGSGLNVVYGEDICRRIPQETEEYWDGVVKESRIPEKTLPVKGKGR